MDSIEGDEPVPLKQVLRQVQSYPWNHALFVPTAVECRLDTPCLVLDPDDVFSADPDGELPRLISVSARCEGMNNRWGQIREWLETNAPELTDVLRQGATPAEITDAEATVGIDFPPSVRESYLVHNGQSPGTYGLFGGWRLLPLTDLVREWENQREIERDFEFGHWDPETAIPIMDDGGGNFLYVEHAPEGSEVPVIEWWHEQPTRDVKAPSFAAYLDAFLDALDAGEYVYLEDDGALVHEDDH